MGKIITKRSEEIKYNFVNTKFIKVNDFKKLYTINGLIGVGAFGSVYCGFRSSDCLSVAVKHIDKQKVIDWRQWDSTRIPVELYVLESLQSVPGVVRLVDWYETDYSFLIVMERPENTTDLFEMKRQKVNFIFKEFEIQLIFKQLLQTLNECLKVGFIHRDIKPENILVNTDTYDIKLIDFGAAGHPHENISAHFRGTTLYCPPEYIKYRLYYGQSQTVWSLGIFLYELFCGDIPFLTVNDILNESNALRFPDHVSKEYRNIIEKCLHRKQLRRPSIRDLLSHQLFQ